MNDARPANDHSSWIALALLALAISLLEWQAPLPIALDSLAALATACSALGAVALFYRNIRPHEPFATMCIAVIQILLFSALAAILSYLLARGEGQLWDETFARWDLALGLDWLTFVRWIDAHPWTVMPLRLAYASLIPQILALVLTLGFTARLTQLRTVTFASILCGMVVVGLSGLFPAVSNFAHLGLTSADFRHIDPWAGTIHLPHYYALRSNTMGVINLHEMQGIVTFPSYHAALSTVTLWGFWWTRIELVRWPGMAVAMMTIIATPVDGGHYFVDVFAGMAIAFACIAIAGRAVHWSPAFWRLRASPSRHSRAASGQ